MEKALKLFKKKPCVINIGLEYFYNELKKQGVDVVHVVWKPKPKLEKDLEEILDKIL